LRGGNTKFDKKTIRAALDSNLQRLQTDHIDIYQLHWPERQTNFFGQRGYTESMAQQDTKQLTPFLETIEALNDEITKGRIRAYGLSNDTPWGVMRYLAEADKHGLARPITIQNPYSLLNRLYEVGLAEISHREQIGLLAYSPLAFGVLSGKYLGGNKPANSRLSLYSHFTRYLNAQAQQATQAYAEVAKKHHLDMAQMALAFVNSRSFVTANIIGATTIEQLASNIASVDLVLSQAVLADIEAVQTLYPNPAP
jgi:aryl-alcohol dehydrogenase-like predicted oxidoreductase